MLFVIAIVAVPADSSEPDTSAYRVSPVSGRAARTEISRTGAGIDEVGRDYVVVQATRAERNAIEALGYRVEAVVRATGFPAKDSDYHDFAEMRAELAAIADAHPSTVRRFTIGHSYEGRPLEAVRIADDPTDNQTEPGVLFVASHHAREHLTVEVALDLVRLFAESTDPAVTALVGTRQIYVVPNLNPDGSEFDIATGSYKSWRKNRQPNGDGKPVGTDLNRNYSYRWGCCRGSSGKFGSETYRGAAPFSAPETVALRDFVDAHANIATAISYHSYGDLILYPYGYTYTDVPADMTKVDHATFVAMAKEMARTSGYKPQQASDLYITDGDFNDWMYGAKGIYPFTFELVGGGSFYPDDSRIPIEQAKNRAAAIYAASMADCPTRAAGVPCDGSSPPAPSPSVVANGGFEAGLTSWQASGAAIVDTPVHGGTAAARLGAANGINHKLAQDITVPDGGRLQLFVFVTGTDTTSADRLRVQITTSDGSRTTVAGLTSAAAHDTWQAIDVDVSDFAGQTVELRIKVATDSSAPTTFFVDDVATA